MASAVKDLLYEVSRKPGICIKGFTVRAILRPPHSPYIVSSLESSKVAKYLSAFRISLFLGLSCFVNECGHLILLKRGQLFQVSKIFSDIKPVQFKLIDLKGARVPGRFYREQLTKSPPPKEDKYFFVEHSVKSRKVKGKKQYLVKYLYYPNKFNEWVDEKDLIISKN